MLPESDTEEAKARLKSGFKNALAKDRSAYPDEAEACWES